MVWCVTFMAQQVILTKCVRACWMSLPDYSLRKRIGWLRAWISAWNWCGVKILSSVATNVWASHHNTRPLCHKMVLVCGRVTVYTPGRVSVVLIHCRECHCSQKKQTERRGYAQGCQYLRCSKVHRIYWSARHLCVWMQLLFIYKKQTLELDLTQYWVLYYKLIIIIIISNWTLFLVQEQGASAPAVEVEPVKSLQSQVDGVKDIMTQNVERILARGERLDDLMDKSEDLQAGVRGPRLYARINTKRKPPASFFTGQRWENPCYGMTLMTRSG